MKIYCDNCGAGYKVNLDTMSGDRFKAVCKKCGSEIIISRPTVEEALLDQLAQEERPEQEEAAGKQERSAQRKKSEKPTEEMAAEGMIAQADAEDTKAEKKAEQVKPKEADRDESAAGITDTDNNKEAKSEKTKKEKKRKKKSKKEAVKKLPVPRIRMGLMSQATLTFILLLLMATAFIGALFYTADQVISRLNGIRENNARQVIAALAEDALTANAKLVAREVASYLSKNPEFSKDDFNLITRFKDVAVRTIGQNGYTFLYELPGKDGIWRIWTHPEEIMVYSDLAIIREKQKKYFQQFWTVITNTETQPTAYGSYSWKEANGVIQDKLIACAVIPESRFVIAAISDAVDDSIILTEQNIRLETLQIGKDILLFAVVGCLAMLFFGFLFVRSIISRLLALEKAGRLINSGELEQPLYVRSLVYDEITGLAVLIRSMQQDLRLGRTGKKE